ncbi:MAG: ribonuclease HI family protein [Chloroflexi bacterium]|nr:MAG: ribonuclease HI family protein [Chloroflexota bacterium]
MRGVPRHRHVVRNADPAQGRRARAVRELRPHPRRSLTKFLRLRADGASRGNPGPAATGIVIEDEDGMKLRTMHRWLGVMTNNEAEYHALIDGLKAVESWKPDQLEVCLDSKLVVEQVNGGYRVKEARLKELHARAKELLDLFPNVKVKQVPREQNKRADYLANQALDEHGKG